MTLAKKPFFSNFVVEFYQLTITIYEFTFGFPCFLLSKPIIDGKLYELQFGHQEVRLHGVSYRYH